MPIIAMPKIPGLIGTAALVVEIARTVDGPVGVGTRPTIPIGTILSSSRVLDYIWREHRLDM